MSLGDKLKFIVTGKRPEYKDTEPDDTQETIAETEVTTANTASKNIFEEEKGKSEQKNIPTAEAQFEAKTGMTLQKAESLLKKWNDANETEKCIKGATLITEFFPEHPSKKYLKNSIPKTPSAKKTSGDLAQKIAKNPLQAVGISYDHGEENLPDENETDDTERLWSALSYIPFASVFVIMTQKDSKFTMYHAYQALALLFLSILVGTFGYVLGFIGMGFIAGLIHFFIFFMSVFAGFTALQGRYVTIPFISGIAKTLSGRK